MTKYVALLALFVASLANAGQINPGDPTVAVVPTSDTTVAGTLVAANQFPANNTGVQIRWSVNLLGQPYGSKACFMLQANNYGADRLDSITVSITGFVYGFSAFNAALAGYDFSSAYPATTVWATYEGSDMTLAFDPPMAPGSISPIVKMCTSIPASWDMSGPISGVLYHYGNGTYTDFGLTAVLPRKK